MLADFFINRSDELAGGGNVLYTPTTTEMAANAKTNATAVDFAALTLQLKQSILGSYGIQTMSFV